ncbi:MAG: tRNA lysidine(34) synthetase TilS [Elusimicrobia bacterium]|nr:tRNA lysidine(34) synthetase TilS [Elusimicrobiota bacterium]
MKRIAFWAAWWGKFKIHIHQKSLIQKGDKILVAVSGGQDSVCLAHALHLLQKKYGLHLHLVHMHHGIRRAAGKDALWVQALGRKLNIPTTIRKFNVGVYAKNSKRSLEDAGRKIRYQIFSGEAKRLGFKKVATAHHLDDHVETVLLNLIRGTQAKGLAGIPVKRPLSSTRNSQLATRNSVEVIRPLLCFKKSEILGYLKFWKLKYRTDETNRDTHFTRNWIRLKLLPLLESKNPKIREHLLQLSSSLGNPISRTLSSPTLG